MADELFGDRRRALEEEFFRKQEREAMERLRVTHTEQSARDALMQASGLQDAATIDTLLRLGIQADTVLAMHLVPLVVVAWADGSLADRERQAIVSALGTTGIAPESPAGQLVQGWLTNPPEASLLEAWQTYTTELCSRLSASERANLRASVLGRARAVAEAAGGFLGLGSKVSAPEEAMLQRLEGAFAG